MCTVTVIATDAGYRLVHSRDEQRTRRPGEPPAVRTESGLRYVSPRDPDAGGTWVAAREDGLTVAIMNVNPPEPAPRGRRSRGLIASDLIRLPDADPEAFAAGLGESLVEGLYSPFRLVTVSIAGDRPRVDAWTWRGAGQLEHETVTPPACWATSGLGDDTVRSRVPLFDGLVRPGPTPGSQDEYHRHRWPGRGPESVLMSRADARTVSITAVETGPGAVRMTYTEIPDDRGGPPAALTAPAEVITLR